MLRTCVDEGAVFAPMARDAILVYHVALKQMMMRDEWTAEDWAEVDEIVRVSDRRFGRSSVIFAPHIALAHGWRRDAAGGLARIHEILDDARVGHLPVLRGLLLSDACNYELASYDWKQQKASQDDRGRGPRASFHTQFCKNCSRPFKN